MEKTNELNKFLSYIHMGNTIYRIYDEQAQKFNDEELKNLINKIQEIFKKHETKITDMICELHEKPTDDLTFAGIMGVYKERLKIFSDPLSICLSAIKSTYMGMISAFKFLDENKNLPIDVLTRIKEVIDDYGLIVDKIKTYILSKYNQNN